MVHGEDCGTIGAAEATVAVATSARTCKAELDIASGVGEGRVGWRLGGGSVVVVGLWCVLVCVGCVVVVGWWCVSVCGAQGCGAGVGYARHETITVGRLPF